MSALKSARKNDRGFSLLEMVIVVAIIMIMAAITIPIMASTISNIKLHYAAVDFSGLLQKARMEAVRKNSFYPVLPTTVSSGDNGYFADIKPKNGNYDAGEPVIELGRVTVQAGTGSGAPQESSFTSSFSFSENPSSTTAAFNARGIPCTYTSVSQTTCPEAPGSGFFYFLSSPRNTWAAIVITPSGRVQVWAYDNSGSGSWIQQ
jgi:prepilin-type N-terminal cleavage/methylation domain-containing protein